MNRLLLAIAVCAAAAVAAQPAAALRCGPLSARAGEKVSGMLPVPAGTDGATVIPITLIQGARPGPVLALVAGVHGYEYPPILALQRLRARLDPQEISGGLILVHVANMPSFLKRTIYYSPVDGKNLNRVFPGKPDGTLSERIADRLTREVIERAGYLIDLHCGDGNESLRPYSYWDVGSTQEARRMALAFGLDHIVLDRERPRDAAASVYCSTTATTRGKPAITVESGALGGTDEASVARIERGVLGVMRLLKMVAGEPELVANPVFLDPTEVLRSPVEGLFYPLVERGHTVGKGTLLGYVTDFFGARTHELRAPFSGEVLYILGTPPVSAGEPLAMVGHAKLE